MNKGSNGGEFITPEDSRLKPVQKKPTGKPSANKGQKKSK